MIALLENGQREDGSVALPECLVRFGAPAVLPRAGARRLGAAPGTALARRASSASRRVPWMSNVVSSRVISKSRSTVGFEQTSAMRPRGA